MMIADQYSNHNYEINHFKLELIVDALQWMRPVCVPEAIAANIVFTPSSRMGAAFMRSQPEPEAKLSTEWQRAKPTLLFHEQYSEESSEALSTPSCRSLEGEPEVIVKGIQETPALQELEETVMQARAAEDHKQARKLKARRNSVSLVASDNSDVIEPTMSSVRHPDNNRSRVDTWDVSEEERDFDSDDETPEKTPHPDDVKGYDTANNSPKPTKDSKTPPITKASTSNNNSSEKSGKK